MNQDQNMPVEIEHLQADQEVYGSDRTRVGKVEGLAVARVSGETYLQVSVGLFKTLFIPRSAIAYAVMGKPVFLTVTHDEAMQHFATKPTAV